MLKSAQSIPDPPTSEARMNTKTKQGPETWDKERDKTNWPSLTHKSEDATNKMPAPFKKHNPAWLLGSGRFEWMNTRGWGGRD